MPADQKAIRVVTMHSATVRGPASLFRPSTTLNDGFRYRSTTSYNQSMCCRMGRGTKPIEWIKCAEGSKRLRPRRGTVTRGSPGIGRMADRLRGTPPNILVCIARFPATEPPS